MPSVPAINIFDASAIKTINSIRYEASNYYKDFIPEITSDLSSLREIGNIIMQYPTLQNEFINSLINRIGREIIVSKVFYNPWRMFKKGELLMGETLEEIFVNISKPYEFDPNRAESEVFKREIPDVRTAFHTMNYQKEYPGTVTRAQLKQAFLSMEGVTTLITGIINSMYTAMNYDEFLTMKYLLAKHIIDGRLYPFTIPTASAENAKSIVSTIKGVSNNFDLTISDKYNIAGVMNQSLKENQVLIVNSQFDAIMDVEVLASAFNMSKAEFMGRRVLIDGFGELPANRLSVLFENDANYTEIPAETLTLLNNIPCVIVDKDFFMVYDNLNEMGEIQNPRGLYWNYFLHAWKTFSVSPFANSAIFVAGTPSITSVTVSPATATLVKTQSLQLSATVVTENWALKSVNWSIDSELSWVNRAGLVTIGADETATTITVTATSVYDPLVLDTAVITVS